MGKLERQPSPNEPTEAENLNPRHFYAAYVFDQADKREKDIRLLLEGARDLDYKTRYWWLSDAMDLQGSSDRLIVCVHHPSNSEDAGMDLYKALREKGAIWDDLEAAVMDEYRDLGAPVERLADFHSPHGNHLFPQPVIEKERDPRPEDALLTISKDDVRKDAQKLLGRDLTREEFAALLEKFKDALDSMDWMFYLEEALRICQENGKVGPAAEDPLWESMISED
jgi:hypothetical protein